METPLTKSEAKVALPTISASSGVRHLMLWQQLSPKINKHTHPFKILSPYSLLFSVFSIQNIVAWWVKEDAGVIKKPVLDKSLNNFFLTTPSGIWDLSSPTGGQTGTPCSGSTEH